MMSSPILVRAYAKVNFYLDVIRKRPDGYHDIETIFQSVSLQDTLEISRNPTEVEVITAHPDLPAQEQNLVYKAAALLREETEIQCGATIALEKNIPIGAGLAGGSADAAATLAALNLLWEPGCDEDTLLRVAARTGSDVPFCLVGGTAAGSGRGEKLLKLPSVGERWLVIVTPPFSVSTADVYSSLDLPVSRRGDSSAEEGCDEEFTEPFRRVIDLVRAGDIEDVLHNAMERVVLKRHPELNELKTEMERAGCTSTLMSGSGPTVFGLVRSRDDGVGVVEEIKRTRPDHFVVLASTVDAGWETLTTARGLP
jgi:4-diphosphocytidyl-2-C-methyl-D-erythritol kinase